MAALGIALVLAVPLLGWLAAQGGLRLLFAVVVWRVRDTAQAACDVDDFETCVKVRAEAALRHLASSYACDDGEDLPPGSHTLRGGMEAVSAALRDELQARFDAAGVEVQDARLSHLAPAAQGAGAARAQAATAGAARRRLRRAQAAPALQPFQSGGRFSMKACTPSSAAPSIMLQAIVRAASA